MWTLQNRESRVSTTNSAAFITIFHMNASSVDVTSAESSNTSRTEAAPSVPRCASTTNVFHSPAEANRSSSSLRSILVPARWSLIHKHLLVVWRDKRRLR